MPHIWKHRDWWFATEPTPGGGRYGRAICGYHELGAVFAHLKGGEEAVREWSKQNPPAWMTSE